MSETNSYMDENVRHVVWLFGQADPPAETFSIRLTPSTAAIVYWALREFVHRTGGSVRSLVVNQDYPAALHGHAEVVAWCKGLQKELAAYVSSKDMEVGRCR